ncbi:hypothetical protein M2129_002205 [Polynucleobacter sphagniphilus]|nr:hypothetical protein [Polynucleobacter sphagniphilus]
MDTLITILTLIVIPIISGIWEFLLSHFFEIIGLIFLWGIINLLQKIYFQLITLNLKK